MGELFKVIPSQKTRMCLEIWGQDRPKEINNKPGGGSGISTRLGCEYLHCSVLINARIMVLLFRIRALLKFDLESCCSFHLFAHYFAVVGVLSLKLENI